MLPACVCKDRQIHCCFHDLTGMLASQTSKEHKSIKAVISWGVLLFFLLKHCARGAQTQWPGINTCNQGSQGWGKGELGHPWLTSGPALSCNRDAISLHQFPLMGGQEQGIERKKWVPLGGSLTEWFPLCLKSWCFHAFIIFVLCRVSV